MEYGYVMFARMIVSPVIIVSPVVMKNTLQLEISLVFCVVHICWEHIM